MYFDFGPAQEAVTAALSTKSGKEMYELKEYLAEDCKLAMEAYNPAAGARTSSYTNKFLAYNIQKVQAKAEGMNWGQITKTNGNITRWEAYRTVTEIFDGLKRLGYQDEYYREGKMLLDNLIKYRKDFEYGEKTSNAFITIVFYSSAYAVLDLAILAMVGFEDKVIGKEGIGLTKPIRPSTDSKTLLKSVKSLNQTFQKGEWSKLIRGYRDANIKTLNGAVSHGRAMEAIVEVAAFMGTFAIIAAISVTAAIAIVCAIRGLITMYYRSAVNIDIKARETQKFLDECMPFETNETALKKQQKAYTFLDNISSFIEAHIIKDDIRADTEIREEDARGLSPSALQHIEPIGADSGVTLM